jgi:hypothetical protein
MRKLVGFISTTIGSTIGWYAGAPFGFMTAFITMIIGTALGLYVGYKLMDNYL